MGVEIIEKEFHTEILHQTTSSFALNIGLVLLLRRNYFQTETMKFMFVGMFIIINTCIKYYYF